MTKSKLFAKAKKSLAVLSTVALLMSCGVTGLFDTSLKASAADIDDLTGEFYIFDQFGNDITDEPTVYVDNSSAAGTSTETPITLRLINNDKEITEGFEVNLKEYSHFNLTGYYTKLPGEGVHEIEMNLFIHGCKKEYAEVERPLTGKKYGEIVETPYTPGTETFSVNSADKTKFRSITVINQEPATDVKLTFNGESVDVNDYNFTNVSGGGSGGYTAFQTFTDKKYNVKSTLVTKTSSALPEYKDSVEYAVFELDKATGKPKLDANGNPVATNLAEISKDGVFTPKNYGNVVIVAYFAPTRGFQYNKTMAQKALDDGLISELPEYIFNPYTQQPTDRLTAVGNKARNVYLPKVDADKDILMEDGEIVWDVDNNGVRKTKTINNSKEAVRNSYLVDGKKALYSDPIIDSIWTKTIEKGQETIVTTVGEPTYRDIITMPKFIPVSIVLRNPAKTIDITNPAADHYLDINGGGKRMTYKLTPSLTGVGYETGATDTLTWKSSNPEIATVDKDGVVTPLKKGTTQITAIGEGYNDDNTKVTSPPFSITVFSKAEDITLDPDTVFTRVGVPTKITAIEGPSKNDPNDEIEWVSDDESICVVNSDGYNPDSNQQTATIIGIKEGSTYIHAKAKRSGEGVESNKCQVTIKPRNTSGDIKLTADLGTGEGSVDLSNGATVDLFTNKDITIHGGAITKKIVDGEETWIAADDTITWTVIGNDQDAFATIPEKDSEKIKFHGLSEGVITLIATCTTTAGTEDEISSTLHIRVLKQCDKVEVCNLDGSKFSSGNLPVGSTLSLTSDMTIEGNYPYAHSDSIKGWTSSNPAVATIESTRYDEKGNPIGDIKALSNGQTNIIVTTASGRSASVTIKVFTTSSVSLGGVTKQSDGTLAATINLNNDLRGTKQLSVTVRDQNNATVSGSKSEWTSSDEGVASVSSNGLVTANDVGTTTVTVTSGAHSESCVVTVYAPLAAVMHEEIEPYLYSPWTSVYEPHPIFIVGTHTLFENSDYSIEYSKNTSVGTATMKLSGLGYYIGEKSINYKINKRPLTDESITVDYIEDQECTGQPVKPELTITCLGSMLTQDIDYSVSYTNNTKPGTATMKITGKGNYEKDLTKTFVITCSHKTLRNATTIKQPTYEETGLQVGTCAACGETNIQQVIPALIHTSNPAISISFEKDVYGLENGETAALKLNTVTPNPSAPATDAFRWESSDPRIVSVDSEGNVKAVAKGTATITVYGENEDAVATCEVGVVTKISSLVVNPNPADTRIGIATELKAEIDPEKSDDQITWESADPSIATVEPSPTDKLCAIVTGVSAGNTTIIAKAKYSDVTAEIDLKVGERNASDVIAISANIADTPTLIPNSTETMIHTHKMFTNQDVVFDSILTDRFGNASDDTTVWEITNNDADTVTLPDNEPDKPVVGDSIKIHAASLGTVTVTAYPQTKPELKTTFNLEVTKRCNIINIYDQYDNAVSSKSLNVDDTLPLHTVLTINDPNHPYDHGDDVFSWTSSDPEVAEVTSDGVVTAKKNGNATITMTTLSEQKKSVSIKVFTTSAVYMTSGVNKPENPGELPTMTIPLNNNFEGKKTIGITIYDQNEAAVSGVTPKWSSTNQKVALVSDKGEVTGVGVGTTIIEVQSGSKKESCMVTVTAPIAALYTDPNPVEDMVYSPFMQEYKPGVTFKIGKVSDDPENPTAGMITLLPDVDYTVEYKNNDKVGTATMTVTGLGYYTGTKTINYKIVKRDLSDASVIVNQIPNQNYTGKEVKPDITVSCIGKTLVPDVDYTVKYANNIEEGKATATISAPSSSNYTGTVTVEFNIVKNYSAVLGDVDNDNDITANDALMILRNSVGAQDFDSVLSKIADVDGDDFISANDALAVLRYSVGLAEAGSKIGKNF